MEKVIGLLPLGGKRVRGAGGFPGFRVFSFFGFLVSLLVCGVEVLRGESIVIKFGKDL